MSSNATRGLLQHTIPLSSMKLTLYTPMFVACLCLVRSQDVSNLSTSEVEQLLSASVPATIQDVQNIVEGYQQQITAQNVEIANANQQIIILQQQLNNHIKNMNERIESIEMGVNHQIVELQHELTSGVGGIAEMQTSVTGLHAEVTNLHTEVQTSVASLHAVVTDLGANVTYLHSEATSLQTEVTGLNAEVQTNVTDLHSQVTGLHTETIALHAEVTGLHTEMQANVTSLYTEVTNLRTDMQTNVTDLHSQVSSLHTETTHIWTNISDLRSGVNGVLGIVVNMDGELTNSDNQLSALQTQMGNATQQITTIDAYIKDPARKCQHGVVVGGDLRHGAHSETVNFAPPFSETPAFSIGLSHLGFWENGGNDQVECTVTYINRSHARISLQKQAGEVYEASVHWMACP